MNDGWIRTQYEINGVQVGEDVPPAGADLVHAPDSVFEAHNMETRGEQGATATEWQAEMTHFVQNRTIGMCWTKGTFAAPIYQPYPPSHNWGGDAVTPAPNSTYRYSGVDARFSQANPNVRSCLSTAWLVSWDGLGQPGSPLLQAGTVWQESGGVFQGEHAFYEIVGGVKDTGGMIYLTNVPIGAGNTIDTQVYIPSLNPHLVEFTVWNVSTATSQMAYIDYSPGYPPNGLYADYIDERAQLGANYAQLPNYSMTSWTAMNVMRSNSTQWTPAYGEGGAINITMTSDDGLTTLSTAYQIGSMSTMSNLWKNCGLYEPAK